MVLRRIGIQLHLQPGRQVFLLPQVLLKLHHPVHVRGMLLEYSRLSPRLLNDILHRSTKVLLKHLRISTYKGSTSKGTWYCLYKGAEMLDRLHLHRHMLLAQHGIINKRQYFFCSMATCSCDFTSVRAPQRCWIFNVRLADDYAPLQ